MAMELQFPKNLGRYRQVNYLLFRIDPSLWSYFSPASFSSRIYRLIIWCHDFRDYEIMLHKIKLHLHF
jgi:hypothetical protein